ncbi:MAG: SAM-dependent methyltransferase [Patescibacteria group bacterium]|nr:SAM-dependent methyltransferase [Patescibacteria group bacterium]
MTPAQTTLRSDATEFGSTRPKVVEAPDFRREFVCQEESMRFACSLEQIVFSRFQNGNSKPTIIEFGSGTGEPVIWALDRNRSSFAGIIHGYEINVEAAETAERLIGEYGLAARYVVHPVSFFETQRKPQADYLIANPPYLPCKEENKGRLFLPYLFGGESGNDISKKLLDCGYNNVFLEVSSYSDPVAVVEHAQQLGYKIENFSISPLTLGVYSRQNIVQERLQEMRKAGKAFYSNDGYLVGGAFFTKENNGKPDLSDDFLASLTGIGRPRGPAHTP